MKKSLWFLMLTVSLSVSAFAGKKKEQNTTDWLNAPTPDGSPTLKETSDWLSQTMEAYGGNTRDPAAVIGVRIDNSCNFYWTLRVTDRSWNKYLDITDYSLPLGAVTSVSATQTGVRLETGQVTAIRLQGHGHYEHRTDTAADSAGFEVSRMPEPKAGGEAPQQPEQVIPRIVNALQHAVSLCQSTYKPPVQTKQPF